MSAFSRASLFASYEPFIGTRLNIAVDYSGQVAGSSGNSDSVSNPLDRALLRHLRSISSVVVTSGATARAENLRPSLYAPIVVLTNSQTAGGFESLATHGSRERLPVVLLTTLDKVDTLATSVATRNMPLAVSSTNSKVLTPHSVIEWLHGQGYDRILLEFGPTLAQLWSKDQAIDEICLSQTSIPDAALSTHQRPKLPKFISGDWNLEGLQVAAEWACQFSRFSKI